MVTLIARAGSLTSAVFLLSLAACGARTGTLDADGLYLDPSVANGDGAGTGAGAQGGKPTAGAPSVGGNSGASSSGAGGRSGAGSTSGGASSAGSTGSSAGGASSAGSGEAGAATGGAASGGQGGSTAGSLLAACTNFCDSVRKGACRNEAIPNCVNDCASGPLSEGDPCQQLASVVLNCESPILATTRGRCSDAAEIASTKCQAPIAAYLACQTATPVPDPPPLSCSGTGTGSPQSCSEEYHCSDGTYYSAACQQVTPNQSSCTCKTSEGTYAAPVLNEGVNLACSDAIAICGGPAPGK